LATGDVAALMADQVDLDETRHGVLLPRSPVRIGTWALVRERPLATIAARSWGHPAVRRRGGQDGQRDRHLMGDFDLGEPTRREHRA
jgi:hypothetical protein